LGSSPSFRESSAASTPKLKESRTKSPGPSTINIARGIDDEIPRNLTGAILALSDKLDTLVGCFTVGMIPTVQAIHSHYAVPLSE